jgi:hypothetical protein
MRWSLNTNKLFLPRRILTRVVISALNSAGIVIISYSDHERSKVIDLTSRIKKEAAMLLGFSEAYQIFMAVKRTGKIKGDIAEVGVYKGGSAKLICEAKGSRTLHLFDTFEGIPKVDEIDAPLFSKGEFAALLGDVKYYLKTYEGVYFYKGLFPATAEPVKDKKFSFAHFDVDTYESTLDCIKFFYPRMSKGGIIISHDYISAPGVRKAFDEFFKDKPEPIIEMSGTQCLIVKI